MTPPVEGFLSHYDGPAGKAFRDFRGTIPIEFESKANLVFQGKGEQPFEVTVGKGVVFKDSPDVALSFFWLGSFTSFQIEKNEVLSAAGCTGISFLKEPLTLSFTLCGEKFSIWHGESSCSKGSKSLVPMFGMMSSQGVMEFADEMRTSLSGLISLPENPSKLVKAAKTNGLMVANIRRLNEEIVPFKAVLLVPGNVLREAGMAVPVCPSKGEECLFPVSEEQTKDLLWENPSALKPVLAAIAPEDFSLD